MEYKSYKDKVLKALENSKKDICNTIGTFIIAEAQNRTPVDTGNLRRSEVYEVMDKNEGVRVGVTPEAKYGIYVEKGSRFNKPKPFLEPAVMDNINKIEQIAQEKIKANMGG